LASGYHSSNFIKPDSIKKIIEKTEILP